MSDHEFEKQVQQKLGELKLRPSDTVWMEVEKNIRTTKRRRFPWLWMAALVVGVSTCGYVLYHYTAQTGKPTPVTQATAASLSNAKPTETSNNSTPQKTTSPVTSNSNTAGENNNTHSLAQSSEQPPTVETPVAPADNNTAQKITINKKPVQQPLAFHSGNTDPGEGAHTVQLTHEKPRYRKKKPAQEAITLENEVVEQQAAETIDGAHAEKTLLNNTMPVRVYDVNGAIATNKAAVAPFNSKPSSFMLPDSLTNEVAAAKSIPRRKPSLWHWGIATNAGYSRIAEARLFQLKGLLGSEKYLAEDLSARSQASPAPATGTSSGNYQLINWAAATTAPQKGSAIQPDLSFSAGLFVQRTISPRLKVSVGLEYSYLSVHTQVGKEVDQPILVNIGSSQAALVKKYYKYAGADTAQSVGASSQSSAYSQKYTYRFQYLEIPVMINWQINKGRRMPPIQLEGGISVAHLLSVDALHYEGIKGVYYSDDELFNKTQFNFVTGLSVGLLQHSKHPLWIGPNLQYALNGMVKKQVSTGQYAWSTGISIKLLLGKL
jgi:hypothetical protein